MELQVRKAFVVSQVLWAQQDPREPGVTLAPMVWMGSKGRRVNQDVLDLLAKPVPLDRADCQACLDLLVKMVDQEMWVHLVQLVHQDLQGLLDNRDFKVLPVQLERMVNWDLRAKLDPREAKVTRETGETQVHEEHKVLLEPLA